VTAWLSSVTLLETVKDVTAFVNGVVAANPAVGLPLVLDPLVRGILGTGIGSAHSATAAVCSDDSLCWYFNLMSGAVKQSGPASLPVMPAIVSCLNVGVSHDSRKVQKRCGKVLRCLLKSMLSFYTVDWKSLPPAEVARFVALLSPVLPQLSRPFGCFCDAAELTGRNGPHLTLCTVRA
jgi:Proteasome-substrate-size regulator, mid region